MMYLNNLSEVIKLRLTPEQKDFCIRMADCYGVTPSAFLRMIIDTYRVLDKGDSHEDEQTFLNNKL